MGRMKVVGMVLVILSFGVTSYIRGEGVTTSDVDAILDVGQFEGPGWGLYSRALSKIRNSIDDLTSTNEVKDLKRHVFMRVLGLPVGTNMVMAASHLKAKTEMLHRTSEWAGGALENRDVQALLAEVSRVEGVGTNDLSIAYAEAEKKDRALGWGDSRRAGYSGQLPPNFRAWRTEARRRNEWNREVVASRGELIQVAVLLLEGMLKDLEEGERKKSIKQTLESHGLTMPGDAGVVSDDDFTVSLEN